MVSCAYILYAATTLSLLALRLTNNAEGWSERKENWKFDYVTAAGYDQGYPGHIHASVVPFQIGKLK